jgi:hypothetical protein
MLGGIRHAQVGFMRQLFDGARRLHQKIKKFQAMGVRHRTGDTRKKAIESFFALALSRHRWLAKNYSRDLLNSTTPLTSVNLGHSKTRPILYRAHCRWIDRLHRMFKGHSAWRG